MIALVKLVTFLIGTIIVFYMVKDYFVKNNQNIIIYPSVVFYFFFYIPVACDIFLGRPQYRPLNYGFIISGDDPFVELIFCIIIVYILIVFRSFQKREKFKASLIISKNHSHVFF